METNSIMCFYAILTPLKFNIYMHVHVGGNFCFVVKEVSVFSYRKGSVIHRQSRLTLPLVPMFLPMLHQWLWWTMMMAFPTKVRQHAFWVSLALDVWGFSNMAYRGFFFYCRNFSYLRRISCWLLSFYVWKLLWASCSYWRSHRWTIRAKCSGIESNFCKYSCFPGNWWRFLAFSVSVVFVQNKISLTGLSFMCLFQL